MVGLKSTVSVIAHMHFVCSCSANNTRLILYVCEPEKAGSRAIDHHPMGFEIPVERESDDNKVNRLESLLLFSTCLFEEAFLDVNVD